MMFRPALISVALISAAFLGCHKDEAPAAASGTTTNATAPAADNALPAAVPAQAAAATETNAAAPGELTVGKPAPDFTTTASNGTTVHLAALKGKPVVIYFYPKDETPGCTKEACSFRDAWKDLGKKDAVLIGVSADDAKSHPSFVDHYKLPFLLVSDPDGSIAREFGVPFSMGMAKRQTIVIGADGNVKKIYRTVDVTKHAQEITADLS